MARHIFINNWFIFKNIYIRNISAFSALLTCFEPVCVLEWGEMTPPPPPPPPPPPQLPVAPFSTRAHCRRVAPWDCSRRVGRGRALGWSSCTSRKIRDLVVFGDLSSCPHTLLGRRILLSSVLSYKPPWLEKRAWGLLTSDIWCFLINHLDLELSLHCASYI